MTTVTSTDPTMITANIWPNIIDGQEIGGAGEEILRDSPAHDVRVASYRSATEADVDAAVTAAARAFEAGHWARTSGAERAALLRRVAARIEAERDELALIETLESGKAHCPGQGRGRQCGGNLVLRRPSGPACLRGCAQRPRLELLGRNGQGTDRRGGRDHTVELPPPDRLPEAALRVGRWLHRRGEAQRPDTGQHYSACPDAACRRIARRRRQLGARRRRRRR